MFNRRPIIVAPTQRIYERTEITEHRAPTDVVKLLREMEQAAQEKVLEAIAVEDNRFNCVVQRSIDCASDRTIFRAIFTLNGVKLTADYDAPGDVALRDMIKGLRSAVAEKITAHILAEPLAKVLRR